MANYNRANIKTGVVHFGAGAFHRAHQAYYFDKILEDDNRWGICEIALNSQDVRNKLAPQDYLYSILELDRKTNIRIIKSITDFYVAPENPDDVIKILSNPDVAIRNLHHY